MDFDTLHVIHDLLHEAFIQAKDSAQKAINEFRPHEEIERTKDNLEEVAHAWFQFQDVLWHGAKEKRDT